MGFVHKYCLYLSTHIFNAIDMYTYKFYKLNYLRETLFLKVSEVL